MESGFIFRVFIILVGLRTVNVRGYRGKDREFGFLIVVEFFG